MVIIMDMTEDIKKLMASEKAIIGAKKVLALLKQGKIEKAYLANNCKEDMRQDLMHYATLSNTEIIITDIHRDEFGTLCKKPFPISILGVSK